MFPELGIERIFRRELDALPVPAESLWVPARPDAGGAFVLRAALVTAIALLVGGMIFAVRDAGESGVAGPGSHATAPPRPTCLNGVCIAPVPIIVQSAELGYNLWLPGDWHETTSTVPTAPGLVSRRVFTARSPEEEARVATAGHVPAWNLTVEIWQRQGRSALDWARADLCVAPVSSTQCEMSPMTLRGASAIDAKVQATPSSRYVRGIYVARGDRILILRFAVDPDVDHPSDVVEETFDQILSKIGLV